MRFEGGEKKRGRQDYCIKQIAMVLKNCQLSRSGKLLSDFKSLFKG